MVQPDRLVIPKHLRGDIPDWQIELLHSNTPLREFIKRLNTETLLEITASHLQNIQDHFRLVTELIITPSKLIELIDAANRKKDPIVIVNVARQLEQNLLQDLAYQFNDGQWQLFLEGLGQVLKLSADEVRQMLSWMKNDPEKKAAIFAQLYQQDPQEWFDLTSNDFLTTFVRLVRKYPQGTVRRFISRRVLQFIRFLIVHALDDAFWLDPKVQIDPMGARHRFSDDAELEATLPASWLQLQESFQPCNVSIQALCETLSEVQQLADTLTSAGVIDEGTTVSQLELEPTQLFLEMYRLKTELESWAQPYLDQQASWEKTPMYGNGERVQKKLLTLLYELAKGDPERPAMSAVFLNESAVEKFIRAQGNIEVAVAGIGGKLETMRRLTQDMLDLLQTLEFEDSMVQAKWNEWLSENQAKLIGLIEDINWVLEEDDEKAKGIRLVREAANVVEEDTNVKRMRLKS